MDLNRLYSQHQLSLMQAARATTRLARSTHLTAAELVGERIREYQLAKGAPAAKSWERCPIIRAEEFAAIKAPAWRPAV